MRIDLIITELYVGGAERCLTELAIGLVARGDSVRVISLAPLPTDAPQDQLVQRLCGESVAIASVDCGSRFALPLAVRRLTRLFHEDPPDLVQTFLFHSNVVGTWAAKRADVPIRVGGVRVAQPFRMRLFFERRAAGNMHAVVCVSKSVEQFARQHLQGGNAKFTTIPNSVDVQRFSAASAVDWSSHGIDPNQQVILFIGRLDHQKGLDWLMQAAPKMLNDIPNAALVLVGAGPWQSMIQSAINKLPSGRAALLPWQPDIAPLLAGASVCVLPSRYEGMPNVILEAMASGLPCVSTRVEGVDEMLTHDPESQIIAFGDSDALRSRVKRLLDNPELAKSIGDANQRIVLDEFTRDRMIDRYRELYQSLCLTSLEH